MTQQVRDHLAGCDRCTRDHDSLRSLATLTAAIPFEDVPGSLHQRIMASLNQATFVPEPVQIRAPRRSAAPLTWAWAAFATGVVAVACGTLQHRLGSTPELSTRILAAESPALRGAEPTPSGRTGMAVAPNRAEPSITHSTIAAPEVVAQAAEAPEPVTPSTSDQATEAVSPAVSSPRSTPASARLASSTPAPNTERPQPAPISPSGKLASEPRVSEPMVPAAAPVMTTRESVMAVPGDPIVNTTGPLGPPEPVVTAEKEAPNRMVGMAMETESPGEEDEGLRSFRMFLQENSRTVPQPPSATPVRERRMRKSL